MTNPSSEPAADVGAGASALGLRVRLGLHLGIALLGAGAAGGLLGGTRTGASAAMGVALAAANLLLMRRITAALTGGGGSAWLVVLPFKLVALVGVAYALVAAKVAEPVPLVLGFALLPLTAIFLPRPSDPARAPSRVISPGPILPGRAGNH